jgi:hypothetical protein
VSARRGSRFLFLFWRVLEGFCGWRKDLPVWSVLAVVEDFADEGEVLVFFVRGIMDRC